MSFRFTIHSNPISKHWLVSSVLYFLLFPVFLTSCLNASKTMDEMKPYDGPIMEINNMETVYSDSAETKVKVKAKKQLALQNGNREFPEGILVEFYEGNTITSTLTSNFARFYKETNKYMVSGNVIIRNLEEEKTLKTEELFWLPGEQKIFVEKNKQVVISTKTDVLYGEGLEAKEDFSSYKILKPVGTSTLK